MTIKDAEQSIFEMPHYKPT